MQTTTDTRIQTLELESSNATYTVAYALREARRRAHVSQTVLSEESGIAQADISRIETGRSNPTLKTLDRLAKSLGMRLEVKFVPRESQD